MENKKIEDFVIGLTELIENSECSTLELSGALEGAKHGVLSKKWEEAKVITKAIRNDCKSFENIKDMFKELEQYLELLHKLKPDMDMKEKTESD